jgi:alkylated DNA repair dioxygenase AlkB
MNLFDNQENLLPYDGDLHYIPNFFNVEDTKKLFDLLNEEINWSNEELILFGRKIELTRKVAFCGDKGLSYTYSNRLKSAAEWPPVLESVKKIVSDYLEVSFNACLLNFYHNGMEGMGWHSDNEKELLEHATIASISLGDSRDFVFKHKNSKQKIRIHLDNGSLLVMRGTIQSHWLHTLPKTKKSVNPRINLTFRLMKN